MKKAFHKAFIAICMVALLGGGVIAITRTAYAASPLAVFQLSLFFNDLREAVIKWLPDGRVHLEPGQFKAIYLTYSSATTDRGKDLITEWKSKGGTAVVFDLQSGNGKLEFTGSALRDYIRYLHQNGIMAVGRYVVLKVPHVAYANPQWTLKNANGTQWESREGPIWLDASHPELQEYLYAELKELAKSGIDEIQFDYIRFPERTADPTYTYNKNDTREEMITDFVCGAYRILQKEKVQLGLDVFGVIVWNNGYDGRIVGQHTADLSHCSDAIYPMTYPSHFGDGFAGVPYPALEPEYFVEESTKMFIEEAYPNAAIRPWIQGFAYKVPNYSSEYVKRQIKVLPGIGADGYAVWNASNVYDSTFGFQH